MSDRSGASPQPDYRAAPDLTARNLQRVVPVGQQQQVGDVAVLIYSLELYATGFLAVVRLSWIGESGGLPHLTWAVQDDIGTVFTHYGCGGSGGGKPPHAFSWRLGCSFGPSIPDDATDLDVTVSSLGFSTVTVDDNQKPHVERGQTITGPWQFRIPFNGGACQA